MIIKLLQSLLAQSKVKVIENFEKNKIKTSFPFFDAKQQNFMFLKTCF
jgi:hypothetical protein